MGIASGVLVVDRYSILDPLLERLSIPVWLIIREGNMDERGIEKYTSILSKILSGAKEYIDIYDGNFNHLIWNDDKLIAALKDSGVERKWLACYPAIDPASKQIAELSGSKEFEMFCLKEPYKEHFIATDNAILIEAPHKDGFPNKAILCRNASVINEAYDDIFHTII